MQGKYIVTLGGEKMASGLPRSAMSVLLDRVLLVLNPATGLATVCILGAQVSVVRVGTVTGTESG